jgi:GDPmannose 4,6-dehydratase
MKRAFITGITGQDGHHLSKLLLSKGYEVSGLISQGFSRKYLSFSSLFPEVTLHNGDLRLLDSLTTIIETVQPDEIYHLGGPSSQFLSYANAELTADITGLGTLRLLEAVRKVGAITNTRIFNASSSEIFGQVLESPQTENTSFHPRSPYGIAKTFSYHSCVNYREVYGMHISSGISFNHEGEYRGYEFVTRKISSNIARIALGLQSRFSLGDIRSRRDWGYAGDYVEAMWLMLQQDTPDDYIIATGKTHTVEDFIRESLKVAGLHGEINNFVDFDNYLSRPREVGILVGDASKAREKLGWSPRLSFEGLVNLMVVNDLQLEATKQGHK